MPPDRPALVALLAGLAHASVLLVVALELGYPVGPSAYSFVGACWRYGGLVVVAAVPVWLALRYRLILPLVALVVTSGYVLGAELTPPGPTFRDVAELERLDEPTGILVVEHGLYVVRYMVDASVWVVGFLFAGLVEAVVRIDRRSLPSPAGPAWLSVPATRQRAAVVAAVGGLLHAVVMVWFASRLGLAAVGSSRLATYAFGAVGMWVLAAGPVYALLRHRLVAPASLLTAFVLLDARAAFTTTVDDPHALYFGVWFVYLAVLLAAAGVEHVLRWTASRY